MVNVSGSQGIHRGGQVDRAAALLALQIAFRGRHCVKPPRWRSHRWAGKRRLLRIPGRDSEFEHFGDNIILTPPLPLTGRASAAEWLGDAFLCVTSGAVPLACPRTSAPAHIASHRLLL